MAKAIPEFGGEPSGQYPDEPEEKPGKLPLLAGYRKDVRNSYGQQPKATVESVIKAYYQIYGRR